MIDCDLYPYFVWIADHADDESHYHSWHNLAGVSDDRQGSCRTVFLAD
jgi:hypothetical protein